MKKHRPYKLAYFVTHPIQYQVPLLRLLSARPEIELSVFFLSDISTRNFRDAGFGQRIEWDTPLLEGYRSTFLPCRWGKEKFGFWHPGVSGIRRVLTDSPWDAVWFHGYAHHALMWGIINALQLGIPLFFRGESTLSCSPAGGIKDRFIRRLIRHMSALLWISSDNREYYIYYGARKEQLFFVPYAVDNDFFQAKAQEAGKNLIQLKQQLGIHDNLPVILYASKFLKRKNPVVLFDAYARLSEDGISPPPAYLLYIGNGEERGTLEQRIEMHGWQNRVKLLGFKNQTELPAYYALCDLFVLPSSQEPFGLVINEVMNAGKAVISTEIVGASRDLVQPGRNGLIVPAGDVSALASALQQALSDREQLRQMGNESRKIIEHWSFSQDVTGILQALRTVGKQYD